jgi:hypothetical protein
MAVENAFNYEDDTLLHRIFLNAYGMQQVLNSSQKFYQGKFRRYIFNILTIIASIYGAIKGAVLCCNLGVKIGIVLGLAIGTPFAPGVGVALALIFGAAIGSAGLLLGMRAGAEIIGGATALFVKHTSRLFSALFNEKEANPTNPYKYKVTAEEVKTKISEANKQQYHLPTNGVNAELDPNKINQVVADCNNELQALYARKKAEAKPNVLYRMIGFKGGPFWSPVEQVKNAEIDRQVEGLKSSESLHQAYFRAR